MSEPASRSVKFGRADLELSADRHYAPEVQGGIEWLIDGHGCSPARLRDRAAVIALLDQVVAAMQLQVLSTAIHVFPGAGGITALYLLSESHLAIHTFPETSTVTLNVYCCVPRTPPKWGELMSEHLDANQIGIAEVPRGGSGQP